MQKGYTMEAATLNSNGSGTVLFWICDNITDNSCPWQVRFSEYESLFLSNESAILAIVVNMASFEAGSCTNFAQINKIL